MIQIKKFVFNSFQVNTYVLYDETRECVIIDAACSEPDEEDEIVNFIAYHQLKPIRLLSTHAHIDHILGNDFISEHYKLTLEAHKDSLRYLKDADVYAASFGLRLTRTVIPGIFLDDGSEIHFGSSHLKVLYTPGHAAGSLCFYCEEIPFVISGDVLFYQSIGRTDLPGGNYNVLKNSIWGKLFVLPDHTLVYPGHGPETSIGSEKVDNPFIAIG